MENLSIHRKDENSFGFEKPAIIQNESHYVCKITDFEFRRLMRELFFNKGVKSIESVTLISDSKGIRIIQSDNFFVQTIDFEDQYIELVVYK